MVIETLFCIHYDCIEIEKKKESVLVVGEMEGGKLGTILITNDDGIDAPGLRALVQSLVVANLFNLQVCAPDR